MTMKSLFYSREVELWLRNKRGEHAATAYRGDCEHSYLTFIRYHMNDTRETVLRLRVIFHKLVGGNMRRYRESVTSYVNGDTPPHYPMPAIPTDCALHIRYPAVLSDKDRLNADAYFRRLLFRQYGKKQ